MLKRTFDVIFSLVALAFSLPVIAVAWAVASLETHSNGFFVQKRIGLHGNPFNLYKIKTMQDDSSFKTNLTTSKDPRITRSGKLFRKLKIDELPQFVNILKGDMSVVGPRPEVPERAESLSGEDRVILSVRPGITGPATIKYKNLEEILAEKADPETYNRNMIWPDKIRINKEYIKNWSLLSDINIIIKTVSIIFGTIVSQWHTRGGPISALRGVHWPHPYRRPSPGTTLLELKLGNAAQACRQRGMDRTSFYRECFEQGMSYDAVLQAFAYEDGEITPCG